MKRMLTVTVALVLLAGVVQAATVAELISEGDALYAKRDVASLQQAVDVYARAVEQEPASYEAQWKCARACGMHGEMLKRTGAEGWKAQCAAIGQKGMAYAEKARELEPQRPEGHFYEGRCAGVYSDGVSIVTAIGEGLKNRVQGGLERSYELDPAWNNGAAILALGHFWEVMPWPIRSTKKSLKYFNEYEQSGYLAKTTEPDQAALYYAELLVDLKGKANRAKAEAFIEQLGKSEYPYFQEQAKVLRAEL